MSISCFCWISVKNHKFCVNQHSFGEQNNSFSQRQEILSCRDNGLLKKEKVELLGLLSIKLWKGDFKPNLKFHHSVVVTWKIGVTGKIRSKSHLSETRPPRLLASRLTLRGQLVKILIMQWEKWRKGGGGGATALPISLSLPLLAATSPLVSAAKPSIGFNETPSFYSSLENATTSDDQKNNIPSTSEKRATIGNEMNPIRLQRKIALPKPGRN